MKRIWLVILAAVLILSVVVSFLLPVEEGHNGFWWSHIRSFFALFGFIGCVIIVVIAKLISHYWLERKEDYYD